MPPANDAEALLREERAWELNKQFGLIQAGQAEKAAIDEYYDRREQVLTDNLELVGILLSDYREALSERDQGLLEMSLAMTYKRLRKIPEERARAHDRKVEQDEARRVFHASD